MSSPSTEPDRRRLARAVRAEKAEDLAFVHRDREVLEGQDVAARAAPDPSGDPLGRQLDVGVALGEAGRGDRIHRAERYAFGGRTDR
jgi:hypothetical protein